MADTTPQTPRPEWVLPDFEDHEVRPEITAYVLRG